MGTPRILDLYCKAGGASMGYHMAGFEVDGLDIEAQPNYPFRFFQGNALAINPKKIRRRYVAVVASPPCLGYTTLASLYPHIKHDKLIPATRDLLEEIGLPYIIENVANARKEMIAPLSLCGSSFGLRVRRHRLFELGGFGIPSVPKCNHSWQDRYKPYRVHMSVSRGGYRESGIVAVYGSGQQMIPPSNTGCKAYDYTLCSIAMGIDWMTRLELNQAIPPIYTYWLGRRLRKVI